MTLPRYQLEIRYLDTRPAVIETSQELLTAVAELLGASVSFGASDLGRPSQKFHFGFDRDGLDRFERFADALLHRVTKVIIRTMHRPD